MGMYTEFVFQGETIKDMPEEIKPFIDYFFEENGMEWPQCDEPDHPFFKCQRKGSIGYCSSFYFCPFSLRHSKTSYAGTKHVFLRCDLKNYDSEIQKFIDWIKPYMCKFRAYMWYEEFSKPTIFSKGMDSGLEEEVRLRNL